ncbi:MAG: hypothetical protein LBB72_02525 [Spirochaetaceae bacterium]|jgi:hypothetical protein|nr:hypothetical protein [Spirochaetaceae bacterium]
MFYHSFPRPKENQDGIKKGLAILDSFLKNGILLVPEIILYQKEAKDKEKPPEEYYVVQSRFCLTQIDISELKAHEKYFGGFHLEFTNDNAYALGAIPVFYLPRADPNTTKMPLKKLAANYVYLLLEMQALCKNIQNLSEMLKNKSDREAVTALVDNDKAEGAQSYKVNAKQLSDVLDMITLNIIPNPAKSGERKNGIGTYMDAMLGALKGIGSLFYPTDKDFGGVHEDLYNFRQREWRITAGITVDGQRLDRELTTDEKNALIEHDPDFFGKIEIYANWEKLNRADGCFYMKNGISKIVPKQEQENKEKSIELKPVQEFVKRIIVPKEALEKARAIAEQNNFDPARVVDFVNAMELEALEPEYEAAKNQRRIQLLRSAQALAEGMYKLSVENRVLP